MHRFWTTRFSLALAGLLLTSSVAFAATQSSWNPFAPAAGPGRAAADPAPRVPAAPDAPTTSIPGSDPAPAPVTVGPAPPRPVATVPAAQAPVPYYYAVQPTAAAESHRGPGGGGGSDDHGGEGPR